MSVPGYWMHETSGVLEPVVRKYLGGGELTAAELGTMRAYFRQWIAPTRGVAFDGPDLDELRLGVDRIETTADVRAWLAQAVDLGIDPL